VAAPERRKTRLTPNGNGKHVADGAHLRDVPLADDQLGSTFQLRWWHHVVRAAQQPASARPAASAEPPARGESSRRRRPHPAR
jgi:hypothetical protein